MTMTRQEIQDLLREYLDRFDEPFPVWGYEDDEIVSLIRSALDKGEPVQEGAESRAPKDALL